MHYLPLRAYLKFEMCLDQPLQLSLDIEEIGCTVLRWTHHLFSLWRWRRLFSSIFELTQQISSSTCQCFFFVLIALPPKFLFASSAILQYQHCGHCLSETMTGIYQLLISKQLGMELKVFQLWRNLHSLCTYSRLITTIFLNWWTYTAKWVPNVVMGYIY